MVPEASKQIPIEAQFVGYGSHIVDCLIDELDTSQSLTEHTLLDQLSEFLDGDGAQAVLHCVCDQSNWIHAPWLDDVVRRACERFDGDDNGPEQMMQCVANVMRQALDGDESYWGDEYIVPIPCLIRHTDGRTAVLGLTLIDYLSGPYDLDGIFRDYAAYIAWLRSGDASRIFSWDDFASIPITEVMKHWF